MLSLKNSEPTAERLTRRTKLAYGVGEVSRAAIQNIRVVFLLYFLTNVAGLNAALAGPVLLISRIWDGINDPIVGLMSDRTRSHWGKRYPWMIGGVIPLAVFSFLQWVVPHFNLSDRLDQLSLFVYYILIALLFDTAFTAVIVPYSALAPDLAQTYDERTSLTSFQMGFSIVGGIGVLLLAQLIFGWVPNPAQRFLILASVCSALAILAIFLSVLGTYHQTSSSRLGRNEGEAFAKRPVWSQVSTVFKQREFQLVTGIYVLSWMSVQGMIAILPYFIQNWMNLPVQHVTQMVIVMQIIALMTIPVWRLLSQRVGKKGAFLLSIPALVGSQIGLSLLHSGQIGLMYGCAIGIGIGLSTVYLVPWAMLPDVIDLDELRNGQRREGLFYSLLMQMQKFGLAIALFLLSQGLNWAGFISTTGGSPMPVQPQSVLVSIRLEIGLIPAMVMVLALFLAYCYPITHEVHETVLLQLKESKK